MPETPLNPDALAVAGQIVFENVLGFDKTQATTVAKRAVSSYLAALPTTRKLDLEWLRGIADAAIVDEPWTIWRDLDQQGFYTVGDAVSYAEVLEGGIAEEAYPVAHVYSEDLATHIATFDPPTVLTLIDRSEAAEESRRLVDEMLRAVLEVMGSGPDTDPIIKARQLVARLEQAEQAVVRVREIAKADLKCPCCSGYEEILHTLDGDQA